MQPFVAGDFVFNIDVQRRRREGESLVLRLDFVHRIPLGIISVPIRPRNRRIGRYLNCEIGVVVFAGRNCDVFGMYAPEPVFRGNYIGARDRYPILLRPVMQFRNNHQFLPRRDWGQRLSSRWNWRTSACGRRNISAELQIKCKLQCQVGLLCFV